VVAQRWYIHPFIPQGQGFDSRNCFWYWDIENVEKNDDKMKWKEKKSLFLYIKRSLVRRGINITKLGCFVRNDNILGLRCRP
jgi:hypothetical protein